MHHCSDVTICNLFPKLFLSSRQNLVTKIEIVYDRPSKRATVKNPTLLRYFRKGVLVTTACAS